MKTTTDRSPNGDATLGSQIYEKLANEIIVGKLAARLAAQIVKAYVEKQRRLRNDPMLFSDKADPGSVPIAGVWNQPDTADHHEAESAKSANAESEEVAEDSRLQGGTLLIPIKRSLTRKPARPVSIGLAGVN